MHHHRMALNIRLGQGARTNPRYRARRDTAARPIGIVIKALQARDGQGCLVVDMAPQPAGRVLNASGKPLHGIRVEMKTAK